MLLIQIAIILFFSFILGRLLQYLGQTQVIGYIIAGILLGPSFMMEIINNFTSIDLNQYEIPSKFIDGLATLSMALLMFDIGLTLFHSNRPHAKKQVLSSFSVAAIGMLIPFIFGAIFSGIIHSILAPETDKTLFIVFMGTAMAVSALPVIFRIIYDLGINNINIIPTVVYAAVITDISGWVIIALLNVGSAVSTHSTSIYSYLLTIFLSYVGFHFVTHFIIIPFIRKHLNTTSIIIPIMLCWMLLCAWGADVLKLHAGLGALLAGAFFSTVPGLSKIWSEVTEGIMKYLLLPILFASVGLKTTFDLSNIYQDMIWISALTVIGFVTKVGGSYLGARITGNNTLESLFISIMMNTKGLMELVVLAIGLELGFINKNVYSIMIIVTIILTCMTPPLIRFVLKERTKEAQIIL